MNSGQNHYIFDGYDIDKGATILRLQLFYESGSYKLRTRVMNDSWSYTNSSKYTISDDWHVVEVEWQASSAPGANDGFLSLWIDGTLMETTSGVDNDEHKIGEARLGAVAAVSSTTSGTMYFDHFESRRGSYIGPLAYYSPRYAQKNETQNANVSYQYTSYNPSAPEFSPAMQSGPTFVGADFTYDGDGRRVKSVTTTDQGTSTTYFVGTHYEVTDGVVTKYYYAGSQRIAMRNDGILYFMLGDHLGSTSLVTFVNGNVVSETRYKAWGEVRYQSGTNPTDYTFTGQKSHTDSFGLMFYNARWYDPYLNRFAQADSIIPGGVQGLDRYAYVNNSPIVYTDPTGHRTCENVDFNCSGSPDPVELTQVGDPIPGTNETMIYGGNQVAQLYTLMAGCTTCWWSINGSFTFEQFVGLMLMHEGNGNYVFSMLNSFAGAQQLHVGGGGNGAFGPYCPPGPCHNGVFNYFAAFSESARKLVDTYVGGETDITSMPIFGGRDPSRVMGEATTYGAAMLRPKSTQFNTKDMGIQPISNVTWTLDKNVNSGLSNYGSEMDALVQKLQTAGLKSYTYYPGGNMGIYYFTDLHDGAAVWLSVDGVNTWIP